MTTNHDRLNEIEARVGMAVGGPWGIMNDGPIGDGKPWRAHMEPEAGLTVGSTVHTEPIARVSGYLMPVEANADFIAHAREDILWLIEQLQMERSIRVTQAESINRNWELAGSIEEERDRLQVALDAAEEEARQITERVERLEEALNIPGRPVTSVVEKGLERRKRDMVDWIVEVSEGVPLERKVIEQSVDRLIETARASAWGYGYAAGVVDGTHREQERIRQEALSHSTSSNTLPIIQVPTSGSVSNAVQEDGVQAKEPVNLWPNFDHIIEAIDFLTPIIADSLTVGLGDRATAIHLTPRIVTGILEAINPPEGKKGALRARPAIPPSADPYNDPWRAEAWCPNPSNPSDEEELRKSMERHLADHGISESDLRDPITPEQLAAWGRRSQHGEDQQ